jgi:hypothetical protein
MKALAILTMIFLSGDVRGGEFHPPFQSFLRSWLTEGKQTFMSMGLFQWHPEDGEGVVSKYWYVYFAVAGGLTLVVFASHLFWSCLADAWSVR